MYVDCCKRWQIKLSMLYMLGLFPRRGLKDELCM